MDNEIKKSYQILEVPLEASFQEIKKAYREWCFVWHPDRFPDDQTELKRKAHKKLQQINDAYKCLKEYYQKNLEKEMSIDRKKRSEDKQELNDDKNNSKQDYLVSTTGIDYKKLRFLLELQQWKEADDETLSLMIRLNKIYQDYQIACEDLWIIDKLWRDYSDNQFGFSIQDQLLRNAGHFDILCWNPILISNKYLNFDSNICGHLPAKYITCFYKNRKIYLLLQGIFGVSIKELQASLLRRFVMLCLVLIIVFFVTIIIPVNVFDVPNLGVYSDFYSSYIHLYTNWVSPIIIVFYGIFYMLITYYRERIDDILAKEFSKFFDRVKKCNL